MSAELYRQLAVAGSQVRLLTLLQSETPDDGVGIKCKLDVVDVYDTRVDSAPEYCALSYTWGPPAEYGKFKRMTSQRDHSITCNGFELLITQNLASFLQEACHNGKLASKRFWIDAICVNQDDLEERSRQIKLMARIYSSAMEVISWLGDADDDTAVGFEAARVLASKSTGRWGIRKINWDTEGGSRDGKDGASSWAGLDTRAQHAVHKLFQRNYFTRAWVTQEVTLAQKVRVQCGSYDIDWEVLAEASHHISTTSLRHVLAETRVGNNDNEPPIDATSAHFGVPTTLSAIKEDYLVEPWTKTLLRALIRARPFKAAEARDKVYSLLGLVREALDEKPRLNPTYENASPAATFIDAAIQILQDSTDLLLLSSVEGDEFQSKAVGPLPSWVPDWTDPRPTGLRGTGYLRFWACGSLHQRAHIDTTRLLLKLVGIRVDRLSMVGEAKHEVLRNPRFPQWLEIIRSLPPQYEYCSASSGGEHQCRLEAFWRTITTNTCTSSTGISPPDSPLRVSFAKWFLQVVSPEQLHAMSDDDQAWLNATVGLPDMCTSEDFVSVFSHAKHVRMFRSVSGHLGLGSECARIGDEVWILPGSRVPLILRPLGASKLYSLVGGTYLHGFMHGEILEQTGLRVSEVMMLEEVVMR
ncbi:HET-domain-containing protein [Thozetella sp. PMI_491]|nr:HET-domain-containing protein [Thozetella sp. PMI_491]